MSNGQTKLGGTALVGAIIVLGAWLGLSLWLAFHTDLHEVQWSRLWSVLGSIESVAFAAAGALFGTTVQARRTQEARERADKAEEKAAAAHRSAAENAQAAANGKALAAAVKARGFSRQPTGGVERVSTKAESERVAEDELVALAKTLFPD